eukprot:GHVU01128548.1.p1 GENE.GHVU01128548.1~~GHVU01128548.1.p1  ORF type:complete len:133 (-),score=23.40 GHVU01128548.1:513-911(-)
MIFLTIVVIIVIFLTIVVIIIVSPSSSCASLLAPTGAQSPNQWLRVLGGYPEDWPDHPLPLGERCVEALQEGLAAEAQRSYDMRSQNEPVERLLQLCRLLVGDAGDPARVLSAQYRLYCEDSEASERLTQRG